MTIHLDQEDMEVDFLQNTDLSDKFDKLIKLFKSRRSYLTYHEKNID